MMRQMKLLVFLSSAIGMIAVLGVLIWFGYAADWTGFGQYTSPMVGQSQTFARAKTLWDWLQLLIIPTAVALGLFWLNHEDAKRKLVAEERRADMERELAAESAREQALANYIDTIANLLLKFDLRSSAPMSEVREVARAHTLAVVRRLDGHRKGTVLQFLSSAKLITKPDSETRVDEHGIETYIENHQNPIITLSGADFSNVYWPGVPDLIEINLRDTDLRNINLRKADLQYADLSGALLNQADLTNANCRMSQCWRTEFGDTFISGADFRGAEGNEEVFEELRHCQFTADNPPRLP